VNTPWCCSHSILIHSKSNPTSNTHNFHHAWLYVFAGYVSSVFGSRWTVPLDEFHRWRFDLLENNPKMEWQIWLLASVLTDLEALEPLSFLCCRRCLSSSGDDCLWTVQSAGGRAAVTWVYSQPTTPNCTPVSRRSSRWFCKNPCNDSAAHLTTCAAWIDHRVDCMDGPAEVHLHVIQSALDQNTLLSWSIDRKRILLLLHWVHLMRWIIDRWQRTAWQTVNRCHSRPGRWRYRSYSSGPINRVWCD